MPDEDIDTEPEEADNEADTEAIDTDSEAHTEAECDSEPASKKAKISKKMPKKTTKKNPKKIPKKTPKKTPKEPKRLWKKEDISYPALPAFTHRAPAVLRSPFEYFEQMFPVEIVEDIVYQTNLYARQKNVNTKFSIDKHELMVFIGIVLYMGVCHLPAIDDYWANNTRCMQVADYMNSKRFRTIRGLLHFNNNDNVAGTTDRFFKIRPLISSITKQFLKVEATPTQSIDEVMVAYKGTHAGNLRQYIRTKPDKWGLKLFCRASIDGFVHDMLMYQGEPTFTSHHTQLSPEESKMLVSSKTVLALVKTVQNPTQTAIYADNFFTSIGLVEYLKANVGCRYVGTARENRIGIPPLKSNKEMNKKSFSRGDYDYATSNGILALRWKDNKNVTILSSDAGVEPMKKVKRYDRNTKKKLEVNCPSVIREYNGKMGGIDKSDMLTHLYKTPMRARRWYMRLFGYSLDLSVSNAWLLYKRDCKALGEKPMGLKAFRLEISSFARGVKTLRSRSTRSSLELPHVPHLPRRGIRTAVPTDTLQFDTTKLHLPIFVSARLTCKYCSRKDDVHRSRWMCQVCMVSLCLSHSRNCFTPYHIPAILHDPQPGTSSFNP